MGNSRQTDAEVKKTSNKEFEGSVSSVDRAYNTGPKDIKIFFVVQMDKEWKSLDGWDGKRRFQNITTVKGDSAGTSMAYANTEVRVKLFKSKSYLLPGDVGLLGFYDIGRVWLKSANSNKWHQSYGAGLYFVPFNLAMISASIGFSEEDKLFNFSVGTKFNLTF